MRFRSVQWIILVVAMLAAMAPAWAVKAIGPQQLRMLNDRVLVQPDSNAKTATGIIIPDSAKDKGQKGVVVAVGPGRKTDSGLNLPVAVQPGDQVLFGGYAGSTVTLEGGEYVILREDEILAVIEE